MKTYHVSKLGKDDNRGNLESPFLTISKAAEVAVSGDDIIVHEGVYREWVQPKNSGKSDIERITYRAADDEKVVIKGSEIMTGWELVEKNIWKVEIDNTFFGDFNPYEEAIGGDWFLYPTEYPVHLGDVYLNGKSFYEAKSKEDLFEDMLENEIFSETNEKKIVTNLGESKHKWYCTADNNLTTIYADFKEKNPNEEVVEINVRRSCFMPIETGKNYITVSGFEMAQAACRWAPPTAEQDGIIAPYWSKGWIIENNHVHDAKCSGISLGKEKATGQNELTYERTKPGYQYQLEVVFRALEDGWSKEKIGSHIVRNNCIHDCGQTGIVGHLGCAFSKITNNHIYNIATKYEIYGFEIAGIKFHAAVDTVIENNRIHHCTLGTWLDWQAQGTRISKNIYYENTKDIFLEVTHGPCVIDNNILASSHNVDVVAQGTAFVHNLLLGTIKNAPTKVRSTPYHLPHSTHLKGFSFVFSGDDRVYNNIFAGKTIAEDKVAGTSMHNEHAVSIEEYIERIDAHPAKGHYPKYLEVLQPVYINHNIYYQGATVFDREKKYYEVDQELQCQIVERDEELFLEIDVDREFVGFHTELIDTQKLGKTRISDAIYDDMNGESIVFDNDLLGEKRLENIVAGPIQNLKVGKNILKLNESKKW